MNDTFTTPPAEGPNVSSRDWIHLTDPKSFSRLLYPNPVCLLSTVRICDPITQSQDEAPVNNESKDEQVVSVDADAATVQNIQKADDSKQGKGTAVAVAVAAADASLEQYPRRNVMVLSWLTATNNQGSFVFSICKRRHTASMLLLDSNTNTTTQQQQQPMTTTYFVLSVPVRGMEQLVLEIGGVSGRWGSKFPDDYPPHHHDDTIRRSTNNNTNATTTKNNSINNNEQSCSPLSVPLSKRQRKKQRRRNLLGGIPGLKAVPFGHEDGVSPPAAETSDSKSSTSSSSSLFAIHGTVAHLKCRMVSSLHNNNDDNSTMGMDDDHHLVMAQVMEAHVHPLYWDSSKSQFRPQYQNVPPYLTFLGSQTFGHVTVDG
jgi:flavin reductase (DIM6/NTAB) family NADH-FMN oxidoreductase RutF